MGVETEKTEGVNDSHKKITQEQESRKGMGNYVLNRFGEGTTPLISVIIPVYNVAPYLQEALDSVVNQTYKELEIIVVDDGSTDGSREICDEYKTDSRFTLIYQNHKGVSAARNAALDVASGEFIGFLDPDDAYHPDYIQSMLETILESVSDIVICWTRHFCTDKKMGVSEESIDYSSNPALPGKYNRIAAFHILLEERITVAVWDKLYKRELWSGIRFPEEIGSGEDRVALFQVFDRSNDVYVMDKFLYFKRKRQESISETFSNKIIRDTTKSLRYVADFLRMHFPDVFSEQQIMHYDVFRLNYLLGLFIKNKDRSTHKYLLKQMKELVRKIEACDRKTKIKCFVIRHFPWAIELGYPAYISVKSVFTRSSRDD